MDKKEDKPGIFIIEIFCGGNRILNTMRINYLEAKECMNNIINYLFDSKNIFFMINEKSFADFEAKNNDIIDSTIIRISSITAINFSFEYEHKLFQRLDDSECDQP